jgi:hypothetical protein
VTILRTLAAMARLDDTVREGLELTRRKIAMVVAGVLALLACAMTAALWLAVALYFWLLPQLDQAGAAAVTGLVFLAVVAIALFMVAGAGGSSAEPARSAAQQSDLVAMLQKGVREESERAPKPIWDLAAMLAVGVVAGLSDKRKP